jgi:hypothetical protein
MERSKEKKERRLSAPLPATTAATIQGARQTANTIISNVLQKLAQTPDNEMDTSGSGIAEPKPLDRTGTAGSVSASSGTAGLAICGGSGTARNASTQSGTAGTAVITASNAGISGTAADSGSGAADPGAAALAASTAPYRNFHQDEEPVAGAGNSTIFTTARYKNIKTQRQLRGEHTAIGSGPTAGCYECGGIFVKEENRTSRAVLLEDTKELIVSTNSYIKEDWSCISCKRSHPLLPLTSRK